MAKGKKAGSDKHENRIQYKGEQSFVYLVGGRLLHRHKVIKTLAYLESRKKTFFLSSFKKTRKSKDPCIIQVPRSPSGKSYENYDPKYNIYEVRLLRTQSFPHSINPHSCQSINIKKHLLKTQKAFQPTKKLKKKKVQMQILQQKKQQQKIKPKCKYPQILQQIQNNKK